MPLLLLCGGSSATSIASASLNNKDGQIYMDNAPLHDSVDVNNSFRILRKRSGIRHEQHRATEPHARASDLHHRHDHHQNDSKGNSKVERNNSHTATSNANANANAVTNSDNLTLNKHVKSVSSSLFFDVSLPPVDLSKYQHEYSSAATSSSRKHHSNSASAHGHGHGHIKTIPQKGKDKSWDEANGGNNSMGHGDEDDMEDITASLLQLPMLMKKQPSHLHPQEQSGKQVNNYRNNNKNNHHVTISDASSGTVSVPVTGSGTSTGTHTHTHTHNNNAAAAAGAGDVDMKLQDSMLLHLLQELNLGLKCKSKSATPLVDVDHSTSTTSQHDHTAADNNTTPSTTECSSSSNSRNTGSQSIRNYNGAVHIGSSCSSSSSSANSTGNTTASKTYDSIGEMKYLEDEAAGNKVIIVIDDFLTFNTNIHIATLVVYARYMIQHIYMTHLLTYGNISEIPSSSMHLTHSIVSDVNDGSGGGGGRGRGGMDGGGGRGGVIDPNNNNYYYHTMLDKIVELFSE